MSIWTVEEAAERTWATVERAKVEEWLRESERRLAIEVEDLRRLHALSARLTGFTDIHAVLADVLQSTVGPRGIVRP